MRRFYTDVTTAPVEGGFEVRLDDRPVRTPARHPLRVPSEGLAEAVAAEWRDQGETVDVPAMPVTKLATSTLDLFPARIGDARREVMAYAPSDLLCYRVAAPADLARRQEASWGRWLDWADQALGAPLQVTHALAPVDQPEIALWALRARVEALGPWRLMALHQATRLTGSVVLGLAIEHGALDPPAAFDLALLEELFEIEAWGLTDEQARRHARLRADLVALGTFLKGLPRGV